MAIVADQQQFHVLAVDDSITDRKLIERLLKTSSFIVTTVDSGSKALEFLGLLQDQTSSSVSVSTYQQEIDVNLIITDYCMPGMTGYDLLKKIKESSNLKDIPVVIMSSENAPSRITRCLQEGAEEFLLKPVQLSDVKKLRPHILKGKPKDQQQQESQQQKPAQQQKQAQEQPQQQSNRTIITTNITNSITITNKRKALDEEELVQVQERARTRFSSETFECGLSLQF